MARSATTSTDPEADAVLLAETGSVSIWLVFVAVFVKGPGTAATTVRTSVSTWPLASEPIVQRPVPTLYEPWLAAAETNARLPGRTSVTTTPLAVDGPLFVAVTVKVNVCETSGAGFETVFPIATSACGVTVVGAVEELSAGFGSVSVAVTLAVFVIEGAEAAEGVTTMLTVALLPDARLPRAHVTVVVPPQEPWLGNAETNATVGGSGSVTVTLVAPAGPWLVMRSVYVSGWPAKTGSGESVFWIERSARVGPASARDDDRAGGVVARVGIEFGLTRLVSDVHEGS